MTVKRMSAGAKGGRGVKPSQPTRLHLSIANDLLTIIREGEMVVGQPLREEALAAVLKVSRTSVRGALRVLEQRKIVKARHHHGYRLQQASRDIKADEELPESSDEKLYLKIARDRIAGILSDTMIETDLMRRYHVGRHRILTALALLAKEGIVHRGKGREWKFHEILKSRLAREESYDFRLMIEPAALLLPTFRLNKPELLKLRTLQEDLLASYGKGVPARAVFNADAAFHETLCSFSGNAFVLAAVRQQNRLRRLLEYQTYPDASRVRAWCIEHISVIDALLENDQSLAAKNLTKHLENARKLHLKRKDLESRKSAVLREA
jgi:DNA-binding GntR family transcriptional regulator